MRNSRHMKLTYVIHVLGVRGTLKEISLGPWYLLACCCAIHDGLFSRAYPAKAYDPRKSIKMGSVAPSLLRASTASGK